MQMSLRNKLQQPPCSDPRTWGRRWPGKQCVVRQLVGPASHLAPTGSPFSRLIMHSAMVETESPPAPQPTNERPPCLNFTDVNRHNFKAVLPVMRMAIQEATFVAVDAEFTGLFPDGVAEDPLDDYEERYKRLLAAADNFLICQYGLSAFKWHNAPGAPRGGYWEAKTFNAYIFPRPDDAGGWDKRFLCQASSLSYLAEQGFDFNKMIHDGIGYIPRMVREARVRSMMERSSMREELDKLQRSREIRTPAEEELVEEARGRVRSWLLGQEPELLLPLPGTRRGRLLLRLLLQEEFQLPSLGYDPFAIDLCGGSGADGRVAGAEGGGEGVAAVAAADADVASAGLEAGMEEVVEAEVGGDGEGLDGSNSEQGSAAAGEEQFLRLRRLDHWRPSELIATGQQLTPRQRIEMVLEQSGFAQVLDILRDAGRPIVGHNATLDLAYTLSQFNGPLPRTWRAYKALLQSSFPGGLYDTKHIATQLIAAGVQLGDTGLGSLYHTLLDEAWLRTNVPGVGLPVALGGGVPEVRHAPGFSGYEGVTVEKAHEAGFDAYMTGAAFARLLRLVGAKTAMQTGGAATDAGVAAAADTTASGPSTSEADALLLPLGQYRGRVHVMRSDLPYADMYGSDPQLSRPAVLYVAGFGTQTRAPFLIQRFYSLGFGTVHVSMLTVPNVGAVGALVQLQRAEQVPAALKAARKRWTSWTVMTFAEYNQSRLQLRQHQETGSAAAPAAPAAAGAGPGSAGRAVPRLIRTTAVSEEEAEVGRSQGTAERTVPAAAGKAQRRGEGGIASGAASLASSDPPESAKQQQQAGGTFKSKRQRLQAFTQAVAAAASSSGVLSSRRKAAETAEMGSASVTTEDSSSSEELSSSSPSSSGSATEARTKAAAVSDCGVARRGGESQGAPSSRGPGDETGNAASTSGSGPDSTASAADAEAAKRAAERLRNLALAAQRLKGLPVKDDPSGSGADGGGGLALKRPGRGLR